MSKHKTGRGLPWLPQLKPQVWILAAGRLLSQVGTGFTLFYLPIFFVNQVGLSATTVGAALGSASLTGMVGRLLGGSMVDGRFWGRRRTLLLAMVISSLGAFGFAIAQDAPMLVVGNLLMGLGVGFYWPATESMVADLSARHTRSEAYAVTRLADSLGLGLGVVCGGLLISWTQAYRWLFVADGLTFLLFFGVLWFYIPETSVGLARGQHGVKGWGVALRDRRLLTYAAVNILITTYLAQINSTLPLYFKNFVRQGSGFSEITISLLFTWHLVLAIVLQLPIARLLRRYREAQSLTLSILVWAAGFGLTWVCGVAVRNSLVWATLSLGLFAIAMVIYTPIASALVARLAPESLRGVYLSINSQCWAIGYLIGPALGGAAMDQPPAVTQGYWLVLAGSVLLGIPVLRSLDRQLQTADGPGSTATPG